VTQDGVEPGRDYWYHVHFPDAGIFWYHPHVREDIEQALGLFGNIVVDRSDSGTPRPVNREEFLMFDDLLAVGDSLVPFGRDVPNFAIMGRFGNILLVNGEPRYELAGHAGEVVRFFLTNVSNTRTYNISFGGAPIKLVGSDQGFYEREIAVESVVIAPAERYVVDVRFPAAGSYALLNQVQPTNTFLGRIYSAVDTLGVVTVDTSRASPDDSTAFAALRENGPFKQELAAIRPALAQPVDHELDLTVRMHDLPILLMQFISIDTLYRPPVEWTDPMADMNWLATGHEVQWTLLDPATGRENMDIHWHFRRGQLVKLRIRNDPQSFHPMQHPIHIHGQRFLVVSKDGVPNQDLVWKDTVLVPAGSTVDLLIEASNPGRWMLHCHIAEHLQAGMMTVFTVD
jgi:suppressor of ftsI